MTRISPPDLDRLRAAVSQATTPQEQVTALVQLARELVYIDNMLAEEQIRQARTVTETDPLPVTYQHQIAFVYCHILFVRSEFQSLLDQSTQLLQLAKLPIGLHQELMFLHGRALVGLNQYDDALDAFQQTFHYTETHQLNMGMPYLGFALVSNRIGRHTDALAHTVTALKHVEPTDDPPLMAQILVTKASIELRLDQTDQALISAEKAAALCRRLNHTSRLVLVLGNLGRIHEVQGNYQQAFDTYLEAHQLAVANQMTYFEALTLESLGVNATHLKRYGEAEQYLQETLQLSQSVGDQRGVYNAYFCLAELFEAQGDYKQAYQNMSIHKNLYMAFHQKQMAERIAQLEVEHRTAQAHAQTELHRQRIEKLTIQKAQAEQIAQYKEKLLNEASHDLKHPLTAMYLNLQRLSHRESLSENGQQILRRIESSIDQMKMLLEGVLDLAALQIDANLKMQIVSLSAFFDTPFAGFRGAAEQKRIDLLYDAGDPFDDFVRIDSQQFQRVLNNLISNGIKYTPSGGYVCLAIGRHGDMLYIRIADNGRGIGEAELPRIFDQFYRASSSSGIAGSGLGLAISKEIVEQHHGRLTIDSEQGKGTTVTVWLPAVNPANADT